ncbi:hypothetical protein SAMN05421664_0033 [Chryseobacterium soldanellicola]|uniref:Uncharacterized protein n=1 Tax=Chryseobacterium soldanellicola TaxID=311333 RepID=A0A1H0XN66_9FLAO|nr:hypothetical protein [Chryseobacterium soldanellicola]SDQ04076.1 hypothetical protein SAMN05421664_0033 [Chryseobacterium soldanellicola]
MIERNMVKLNNRKYVKLFLYAVLLLSGFDVLMIIGCLTLSFQYKIMMLAAGIVLLCGFLIALSAIRAIEFEISREIISIKCYHPFQKFWQGTLIEFPAVTLQGFSITGSMLMLSINKEEGGPADISVYLQGITRGQLKKLRNSLEQIIKYS